LIYVKYGLAAFRLLDAVAIAVPESSSGQAIDKGGPTGDRQRTVLDIPVDGLRAAGGELDL